MSTSPHATFAVIVTLVDKIVADQPRNLDLAHLRFLLKAYKPERPKPRKRDWAAQKRRQLTVTAAQESVKDAWLRLSRRSSWRHAKAAQWLLLPGWFGALLKTHDL